MTRPCGNRRSFLHSEAAHPGIQVKFSRVQNVEYMPTLWASLKAGKAGISSPAARLTTPWPRSRRPSGGAERDGGDGELPELCPIPWQTDSGAQTFCVPMASVIHGFFYNKKIFSELGLTVPQTRPFFAALDKVKGGWSLCSPRAVSGSESWVASRLGFERRPQLLEGGGWSGGADQGPGALQQPAIRQGVRGAGPLA